MRSYVGLFVHLLDRTHPYFTQTLEFEFSEGVKISCLKNDVAELVHHFGVCLYSSVLDLVWI